MGIDAYFETQYPVADKTEVPYSTKVGLSTYSSFRFLRPLNVLFLRISSLFPANDLRWKIEKNIIPTYLSYKGPNLFCYVYTVCVG